MTTATQQIPSNPALEFAQSILDVTNNGLELIEILRDIAQDTDEVATTNDRIAATNILNDRAFGKSPKQITPSAGPNPDPTPETDANYVETPAKPKSPRLVTRIDESLNRSLGPAPSASQHTPQTPEPFDPNSIHFTIQQHILDITNNGQMLRDILLEIARACPEPVEGAEDDPEASPEHEPALSKSKGRRITPYHRRRAVILLLDRALGSDPNAVWKRSAPTAGKAGQHTPLHPITLSQAPTRRQSKTCVPMKRDWPAIEGRHSTSMDRRGHSHSRSQRTSLSTYPLCTGCRRTLT